MLEATVCAPGIAVVSLAKVRADEDSLRRFAQRIRLSSHQRNVNSFRPATLSHELLSDGFERMQVKLSEMLAF
jgi:hypothetical protein